MNHCYLGLGSNLNHPQRQLLLAITALGALENTVVLQVAPFYKNAAWGRKAQPWFYNTVVEITTRLTPHQLLARCLKIEKNQGRCRRVRNDARTLDIDILYYGNVILNTPRLILPHPGVSTRDSVLIPMSQLKKPVQNSRHCT